MSFARLATRLCAVNALRDKTLAEDRVYDSAITPLDEKISEDRKPVIIVYTDDSQKQADGRDMTGGENQFDLVIEVAIAARVTAEGRDSEGASVTVEIPDTDATQEMLLDVLEHQAISTLSQSRSEWSKLWGRIVTKVHSRQSRRGIASDSGTRFAARQITISCDTLAEPISGVSSLTAGEFWADFVAQVEADANTAPLAAWLRLEIEGTDERPAWERAADALGISDETSDMIGIVPVTDDNGEPVTVSEVYFDYDDGRDYDEEPAVGWGIGAYSFNVPADNLVDFGSFTITAEGDE